MKHGIHNGQQPTFFAVTFPTQFFAYKFRKIISANTELLANIFVSLLQQK